MCNMRKINNNIKNNGRKHTRSVYKKTKRNKGSSIIEISLLIPICLVCVYLYVMLFLFLTGAAKNMERISEYSYRSDTADDKTEEKESKNLQVCREGKTQKVWMEEQDKLFVLHLELRKDMNDPVENIRRWQLVTSAIQ